MLQAEMNAIQKELDKEAEAEKRLKDLEDNLMDDYDELEDVEIDSIELEGDEDEIAVWIETDLYKSNLNAWKDLREKDIEDWIEDLVADIQDEFSRNTEVIGVIYDTEEREKIIEFEKDGRDDLEIDFNDDDYRNPFGDIEDVEDELLDMDWEIDGYDFVIDYIDYDDDEIQVDLIYDSKGSFDEDDWDDLDVEDDIEDLCIEIVYRFEDDADADPEVVFINVYDSEWKFLDYFEFDVDDWKLK